MKEKRRWDDLKKSNGITLIALVVTIIVLIILAGISINLILGDNGIITKANEAKQLQEKSEIKENIILEIIAKGIENKGGITQSEIEEILNDYGTVNKNSDGTIESLTPENKDYKIPFDEIYGGQLGSNTPIIPDDTVLPTDGSYSEAKKVNTPKINEAQGMKLVTFNTSTKNWEEDTTKSDYDYIAGTGTADNTSSRWANATVTKDGVDSYFVWIPRYAYKITYYTDETKTEVSSTNEGYGSIDVKFLKDTGTIAADGTVCKYADDSTLTADDYIIHPAFTSNADLGGGFGELTGLWIGKYETSNIDATIDSMGTTSITELKVVPSVQSWSIVLGQAEMYTYSKEYNTNLKSHMLKNSEWGAVAYLAYSQYGRNGNEIAVNQCSNGITGAGPGEGESNIYNSSYSYDASNFETTYSYTSEQGKKASTTGNVYGIYDMSGGEIEYVASYYSGSDSSIPADEQIFATAGGTSDEYSTAYPGSVASESYIKGDATYETDGWNSDYAEFVYSSFPFFRRGGGDSNTEDSEKGLFNYESFFIGYTAGFGAFRMCIAI